MAQRESATPSDQKYIASVDFGTTSVRCFLFDLQGYVRSSATAKVWTLILLFREPDLKMLTFQITQLYPHQGWNEIDPEEAWDKFKYVFRTALSSWVISSCSLVRIVLVRTTFWFSIKMLRLSRPMSKFLAWPLNGALLWHGTNALESHSII